MVSRNRNMTSLGESREEAQGPTKPMITPKTTLGIGNWNVRTMYAAGKAAQIAMEMKSMNIQILGISESRWNGTGKTQLVTGETVIYSGRDDDNHIHGVAIMMSKPAADALIEWSGISERIIMARFHSKFIKLTLIHAYAPTNDTDDNKKNEFYDLLSDLVQRTHKHDIIVITGDFNAKVGKQPYPYQDIMGKHGEGIRNENGEKLCEFCATNEFLITGTLFPHKNIHKLTWTSPDGQTKNQIDHVLINRKFRTSVKDTRVFRSADVGSDHHLIKTNIKLKLKRAPKECERRSRYDVERLKEAEVNKEFRLKLSNKFAILEAESIDEERSSTLEQLNYNLEKAYNETAKEILGNKRTKRKPWISQNAWDLIEQRKEVNKKINGTKSERIKERIRERYRELDKEVKRQIKKDKKTWVDNIAQEAEEAANKHHMKTLYSLTKKLTNEKPRSSVTIKDKQNNIITNSEDRRDRWREHFSEILNRDDPEDPIEEEESTETEMTNINTNPPTLNEIYNAIKMLKNGKAPGHDGIQAELLKSDIHYTSKKLQVIFNEIWEKEQTPTNWRRGLIFKIPKKGNLKECKNWRGITLLPIFSKVLGRIVIDRIKKGIDSKLRKEQAGYRTNKSTIDQIFILRNIIEQSNEWQSSLYIHFIDFEKAFDSIHRESLWKIMKSYGIPDKLIAVVKALYENFECAVIDDNTNTEWFPIKTGVKQGCNMSGFLFLLVIDWIMKETVKNQDNGIRWKFTSKLDDLDFADDIALLSSTKNHIQTKTDRLVKHSARIGLKANQNKCKVIRMNGNNTEKVNINGDPVEDVTQFEYLGAFISTDGGGTKDLGNRIGKARATFNRLKNIWQASNIRMKTKLKLYKTLVIPVLMYGSETWKINKIDNQRLDVFHSRCLRRILKIKWEDRISNEEIMERTGMSRMSAQVQRKKWRYIGHILRKGPEDDCATALTWAPEGKRKRGRPKTTWRRNVEKERDAAGMKTWKQARTTAMNRDEWRARVEALCATWHEVDR